MRALAFALAQFKYERDASNLKRWGHLAGIALIGTGPIMVTREGAMRLLKELKLEAAL